MAFCPPCQGRIESSISITLPTIPHRSLARSPFHPVHESHPEKPRSLPPHPILVCTPSDITSTPSPLHIAFHLSTARQLTYLFFTSQLHPSIPSPLLPTSSPSILTPCMPIVSSSHRWPAIPPAFARLSGVSSSIGVKKSAIRLASSSLKWYFSFKTSGSAQCRKRWMLRSSPFRLKIS